MTKRFCDLCGKPAHESALFGRFERGEPWRGYQAKDGGCDGTWQPRICVSVQFGGLDFKDKNDHAVPDLCPDCMYSLLDELARKLMPVAPSKTPYSDNLAKVDAALTEQEQRSLRDLGGLNPYRDHA